MRKTLFRDRPCSGHASPAQHAPALPVPEGAHWAALSRPRERMQYVYSTVIKEPRTLTRGRMPAPFFLGGPRAKSCQYVGGRGFGSEAGPKLRVPMKTGCDLRRRWDLERGVRKEEDPQLRILSGTLGNSSSRSGGGATNFGLLRR